MDNERENNDLDLILRAVYGKKDGEFLFWETKLDDVQRLFRENLVDLREKLSMLWKKGKMDISFLFKDDNEANPLLRATESFFNVSYLYDAQMVLCIIEEYVRKKSHISTELINVCKRAVYGIITTKLLVNLLVLLIEVCDNGDGFWEDERLRRFIEKKLKKLGIDDLEIMTLGAVRDSIDRWGNDSIVKLISLDPIEASKYKNVNFYFSHSIFEVKSEMFNLYKLWINTLKEELKESRRCVAMTIHSTMPFFQKRKKHELWYAISGIDDDTTINKGDEDDDIEDVCCKLKNLIHQEIGDIKIEQKKRFKLTDKVLYITEDGKELDYSRFRDNFTYGTDDVKKTICNECLSRGDCESQDKPEKGKCRLMFLCGERKLFVAIGKWKKAAVFTSLPTCDLCLAVQQKKYKNIKLVYPGRHNTFDPIAEKINSL